MTKQNNEKHNLGKNNLKYIYKYIIDNEEWPPTSVYLFTSLCFITVGVIASVFGDRKLGIIFPIFIFFALASANFLLIFTPKKFKSTIFMFWISVWVSLYASELYLIRKAVNAEDYVYNQIMIRNNNILKTINKDFDFRSPLDVLADEHRFGREATVQIGFKDRFRWGKDGKLYSKYSIQGNPVPALSGISKSRTIMCNESGDYIYYTSDRYGFRNEDKIWDQDNIDAILIGDSFAHGACVEEGKTIRQYMLGNFKNILNLSYGGNGPLSELATLVEYGSIKKPKFVFWVYFDGNDLSDLEEEKRAELLMEYTSIGHTNDLKSKQEAIDDVSRNIVKKKTDEIKEKVGINNYLIDFVFLRTVRSEIGLNIFKGGDSIGFDRGRSEYIPDVKHPDKALFTTILSVAKRTISEWGGRLIFVFIPDQSAFCDSIKNWPGKCLANDANQRKSIVFEAAGTVNIPIIDAEKAIRQMNSIESAYWYPGSHLTGEGYAAVGEYINQWIKMSSHP